MPSTFLKNLVLSSEFGFHLNWSPKVDICEFSLNIFEYPDKNKHTIHVVHIYAIFLFFIFMVFMYLGKYTCPMVAMGYIHIYYLYIYIYHLLLVDQFKHRWWSLLESYWGYICHMCIICIYICKSRYAQNLHVSRFLGGVLNFVNHLILRTYLMASF